MAAKQLKKQLIIDTQLLQTSDRNRGMGLFLTGLLSHLSADENLKISFVINRRLPSLVTGDTALIEKLGGRIIDIDLLHRGDNAEFADSTDANRQRLNAAIETLIPGTSPQETVFFIPALFSSEIHPVFPTGTTNLLLFHDLIPFLYYRDYFADHDSLPRKDYAQRFREFYKTDLFVSNSQTTADDLTVYFGVDPSRIVPIYGAAADRTGLSPKKPAIASQLASGFVLMPSGDDLRKNNLLAAQAFAGLKSGLKLAVTSKFSPGAQRSLKEVCPDVFFTGPVSEEEFLWLLDNAKAVFSPSNYEGLGMPLLESVERNALITCSNIPVFVEISQTAFTFFDPASAVSMTSALQATLKLDKSKYITEHKKDYADILSRFSWQNTAKLFLTGVHQSMPAGPKKRLAIFCPSPSSYSAVGKYAFEVHAELSRLFDIDYYAEEGLTAFEPTRPNILEYAANYYPAVTFSHDQADRYDYILYNLGNSEFHIDTILNALRLPANAIVHDTYLNGIFDWLERNGFMVSGRRRLEAILDKRFEVKDSSCLVSLVTNQHTIFCFSDFADKAIKQIVSGKKPEVVQILQPIGVPTLRRERFGKPTVSWAGIISEDKGIGMVAEIANNPNVQIKVFGFGVLGDSPLLQELGDNVSIMKDLTDKEFQDNLQQTEILVNYRPNYHGETSRSTLEAMRHGAVVIVKETGWYSELPDDVVVKVSAEHEIVAAINKLLADPKQIDKIAIKAQDYLREKYGYKQYAELMMKGLA